MNRITRSTRVKAPDPSVTRAAYMDPSILNDELVLNPQGSMSSDAAKGQADKFIKLRTPFIVSTFNTRTLAKEIKKQELDFYISKYNIDILCIQEHRITHSDMLLKEQLGSNTLITSSAIKNSINATIGGVGFALSKRAMDSCININNISDRITSLTLDGNPCTSIICCYSPTNVSSEIDIKSFYDTLNETLETIPAHNMLFVAGDFNARIGPEEALYNYSLETNRNGQQLCDFMDQFNLIAINTRFQKHRSKLWTFTYPNGSKAQLDFILGRKKWRNSFKDCAAFNTFESICSDHRIISC